MRINNNDLIEEAMKRRGFETDRPLRIRFNKKDYAGFNGEKVFKVSKRNDEYVLHLANKEGISLNFYDFLFDNKNDIDVEFVGDKEINPIDIKNQVCKLYCKYIELSKIYRNETISVADLVGETGIPRTYNIANKLEVLAEILGYNNEKVKKDIESED
jgi:hypothetical protein|nr:MAG TPA: hypothetical protein [Caudoviricetes sp.]